MSKPSCRALAVLGVVCALLTEAPVQAAEVYVLRFRTDVTYMDEARGLAIGWQDELLLHNNTDVGPTVRLLAATSGTNRPMGEVAIPARKTVSTLTFAGSPLGGDPFGFVLVVNKLEVPDGVVVSSRAGVYGPPIRCGGGQPAAENHFFGNLPVPVFRSLAAPNQRQLHLPTDLGVQRRRTNVIVYNAGSSAATARIELRLGCDDSLLSELMIAVPPNAVVQVPGLTDEQTRQCTAANTTRFTRYVTVTVDQPSLSHTTTISNEFPA